MKKRQKKLREYYQQKIANENSESLTFKKKPKSKQKYIDQLFFRIFLSSIVLLGLLTVRGNVKISERFNLSFNSHINLTKVANFFSTKFASVIPVVGDETVYASNVYDKVIFENGINQVQNYTMDSVVNLVDGIIIKIVKNSSERYDVTIQSSDGYNYTYRELKTCDYNIYSYVESGEIIGLASYNQSYKAYLFELIIEKDGEYFDFYHNAED